MCGLMRSPEAGRNSSIPSAAIADAPSTVALRLLESAPDAILGVDTDGHIRLANRASAALFGYEPGELIGRPVEQLVPESLRAAHVSHRSAFAAMPRARSMGEHLDVTALRKDGSTLPVDVTLAPVDGPEGLLVTAIVRDATDRRRTEHELELSRRRLAEAEQLARVGSWEWDIAANAVTWSDQLYRIYGLEPQTIEPSYEKFVGFVHEDDRASVNERNQKAFTDHQPFEDVKRVVRADGDEILMRTQGDVVCDEHGAPDPHDRRLRGRHRRARTPSRPARSCRPSCSPPATRSHALDRLGRVTGWNPAAEALFGYEADEMVGRPAERLLPPGETERERRAFARVLEHGSAERFECRRVRRDGTQVDVSLTMSPITSDDGVTGVSVITRDVSERKRLERQLRYLADHDPLTGLLNGRRFEEEIDSRIADTARYGGHGAVLALGLDGLKDINDSHGHSAGDALIRSIAERLRARLRDTDVLARIGGDEMGVLLSRSTREDAQTLAQALLDTVRDHRLLLDGRVVRTTTSIGIAMFNGDHPEAADVLAAAERGLYAAKDAGRDRILTAPAADADGSGRGWALRLREAIDADGLMLQFQPILDLATGRVERYEALVRLQGENGLVPPLAFIGTAERLGLMHDIDAWVLRRAIGTLAEHPGIELEVNVSGRSVGDHDLPRLVDRELRRTGVDPSRLVIEITETAAIANMDDARRFADEILALGCSFALDDFGAGFGSFAYLKHIPADLLKIDGEFIKGPRSHADELIVQSIVAIAKALGKRTVAEYVGDQETIDTLRAMGVDYAQGFFIGRPAGIEEIGVTA